jgi:hypothetical protein
MGLLDRFVASPRPVAPVLLRLRGPGGVAPEHVAIRVVWSPSGRTEQRTLRAESGLCLVPWRAGELAAELEVRAMGSSARLRATARQTANGPAIDVVLDAQ